MLGQEKQARFYDGGKQVVGNKLFVKAKAFRNFESSTEGTSNDEV
jgi:hypothetical protein